MPEFEEWKYAREALLDDLVSAHGWLEDSATVDLLGFGTLAVKVEYMHYASPFDGDDDIYGTLHWPDGGGWVHGGYNERRPPGVDGSGRKFDTRSGPVWWMPPADVKGDAKILDALATRVSRYLREDWGYVGIVLSVERPHEASTDSSLWRVESDSGREYISEILDSLFADLPPAPPLDPVWIVIRDADGDLEVDVFNNEAAAREHAARLATHWGSDQTIVREETVAASAWAPTEEVDA